MSIAHQFATAFASIPPRLVRPRWEAPITTPPRPAPAQPRLGLRHGDARDYVGVPPSKFDQTGVSGPSPRVEAAPPLNEMKTTTTARKLLSFAQLRDERGIPFCRRHLLRLENARKFPRRIPLGENRVGWAVAEIDAWLDEKMTARDAA